MITHFSALLHRYIRYTVSKSNHAKTRRVYEPSELNRVSREYKPGSAYTNKNVSYSYETNGANEVFNLRVNLATGALHTDGSYPYYDAGTLFKDVATDEDGNTFTTYKDVAGRLIMEKRGTDSKTYYVYDGRRGLGISYNILNLPAKVVERNDYYPLGMRTTTGNSYPQLTTNLYKYNGKKV